LANARNLVVGQIYYMIQYEDQKLSRPIISSFTYKGPIEKNGKELQHLFSALGLADENLFLSDQNLSLMLDLPSVVKELTAPNLAKNGIDHAS
jgi:hypothetical protein